MVLRAAAQRPADPEQRVMLAATMAKGFLLHPTADPIHSVEAEPDDMEGIQYPGSVRQAGAQRGCVAPERVQRGHGDPVTPGVAAGRHPT